MQEDQDFVNNFVLTEEALARCEELVREREKSKSKSTLADVLLFSGSVAAVAGAVFFLSQVSHKSFATLLKVNFICILRTTKSPIVGFEWRFRF